MKVNEVEISESQQQACIAAMSSSEGFNSKDIEKAAIKAGVPEFSDEDFGKKSEVPLRLADKLIQQQRAKGLIYIKGSKWVSREQQQGSNQ